MQLRTQSDLAVKTERACFGSDAFSAGIFAYCSFLCERDRKHVCEVLCNALARMEYRGYDSAGKLTLFPWEPARAPLR